MHRHRHHHRHHIYSPLYAAIIFLSYLAGAGSFTAPLHFSSRRSTSLSNSPNSPIVCNNYQNLPRGLDEGHYIIHTYDAPESFDISPVFTSRARPELTTPTNVTLPLALMVLDPEKYPTLSRARKACRKGNIILDRPAGVRIRGRAGDRVLAGIDSIKVQTRLSNTFYPSLTYAKPPFQIPVVYEDDDIALVNKPAGVVTYSHRRGGHGRQTVRAALPYMLKPPLEGSRESVLRRPTPVHRLDKATSGIMVVAKTKQAMVELSRAFAERNVEKGYVAVLNGLPDDGGADEEGWRVIVSSLMGKEAVTKWRVTDYAKSLVASDGFVTQVHFKPKTGRFHQLRIHSSEVLGCPIVGDLEHDKGTESAMKLRENGMFLCSSTVELPHPTLTEVPRDVNWKGVTFEKRDDGRVYVNAKIDLPEKFGKLLRREGKRAEKLG